MQIKWSLTSAVVVNANDSIGVTFVHVGFSTLLNITNELGFDVPRPRH